MASKVEALKAELKVAELEEKLVEAKAGKGASQKLKDEVREARQAFRLARVEEEE